MNSEMTTTPAPHWDLSDIHASIAARSFLAQMERVGADLDRLETLFDHGDVRRLDQRPVTEADGRLADQVIAELNRWMDDIDMIETYVFSIVATDSFDEAAQAIASELDQVSSRGRPLLARLADWVAALGADDLAAVSAEAAAHLEPLRALAERADHQMSEAEERLYASLLPSASNAWYRLHADITSQLCADVHVPGGRSESLPMAAVRGLASDIDPAVRRAAYDAELAAWPSVAVSCALAINSIKGEANTINAKRNWAQPLDASLFANNLQRASFDAMQSAVTDSLADFRRWMRAKARIHGHGGALPWWDLFAPLPFSQPSVSWSDGLDQVRQAFGAYDSRLAHIVDAAVDGRWIDAEPRHGKRGGAFCADLGGGRSMVLLNWNGTDDDVQTTAHELGHAYHNLQLAERTPLQKRLPMVLAETASIFCETLMVEHRLSTADDSERLVLLDRNLQDGVQTVVDIHSRFLFETDLFARRQRRTLGVNELNELMLNAQHAAYGEGLDQSTAHPYMWAVKPHYYGSHFYNWPYTFGLLFGVGLYAKFQHDPELFRSRYDRLLSLAGMGTAEQLAADFSIDLADKGFWTASLDVMRRRIDDYEQLANAR